MSDPVGATAQPDTRFPDGVTRQMTQIAEQLSSLLRHDGLEHLVLYDGDITKIALEAGASGSASALSPESTDHQQAGRQIYYLLEELQPDFAALRTGALIRTVVRVPSGAVLYYLVEPGFHLYGATSALHRLAELDARMADCANSLRMPTHYSPLNYGSWFNDEPWATAPEPAAPGADTTEGDVSDESSGDGADQLLPTAGYVHSRRPEATAPPVAETTLVERLKVQGLHYVAYHESPGTAWACDIFDHPGLSRFFRARTPDQRRDRYRRMSRLLPGVTERMNLSLRAVLHGELAQLVLDVEQGAVYFHPLANGRFLIGVTLDQRRVTVADHTMAELATELSPDGPED